MGLVRKLAKNSNSDFHNLNRQMLCEIMAFWGAVPTCCKCHDHHTDDDLCDSKCNKDCVEIRAYKDIIGLSMALMAYIAHAELRERRRRRTKK